MEVKCSRGATITLREGEKKPNESEWDRAGHAVGAGGQVCEGPSY